MAIPPPPPQVATQAGTVAWTLPAGASPLPHLTRPPPPPPPTRPPLLQACRSRADRERAPSPRSTFMRPSIPPWRTRWRSISGRCWLNHRWGILLEMGDFRGCEGIGGIFLCVYQYCWNPIGYCLSACIEMVVTFFSCWIPPEKFQIVGIFRGIFISHSWNIDVT